MPKTLQIRNLDDGVDAALAQRAAEAGISVPELPRRYAARLASRPSVSGWLERVRRRSTPTDREAVLDTLDDLRGTWPDRGH